MIQSGYTMMHEHVTIDLSGVKKDPDCRLDCKDQTIAEFRALKELGVGNVLEVTNLGMGRDVDYIMDVARASGINILVCTGFYKEPFLPDYVYTSSEEELADLMVAEIEEGIGKSGVKASAIGEFGTSKERMTDMERKVFRSCAMAARRTGRLVTTHTTLGTLGIEQADYLISMGLDPSRIVIGHMDLSNDIGGALHGHHAQKPSQGERRAGLFIPLHLVRPLSDGQRVHQTGRRPSSRRQPGKTSRR